MTIKIGLLNCIDKGGLYASIYKIFMPFEP